MSVAVCRGSVASGFESILALPAALSASSNWLYSSPVAPKDPQIQTEAERSPGEVDVWASIQDQKARQEPVKKEEPYVHPLMRRPSSLLSKKSLEICTENLGCESGSDDYFSFSDDESNFITNNKQTAVEEELAHKEKRMRGNYRCCSMSRASELRRFPPPLPSISRRDGPCLKMRPLRRDGRLVVKAVAVPSQNYLRAQRHNGRLLLSFMNTTTTNTSHNSSFDGAIERNNAAGGIINEEEAQYDTEEEEEEEEEEVQVVDRGTVVEVNVSTKPPRQNKKKVHRSSIVINKFVSFTPTINNEDIYATPAAAVRPPARRSSTTATTAAAAAVAASSLSASSAGDVADLSATAESKLMLTRRRRSGEELLLDMRRCGQLRRPLFFWETCCIATSS